MTFSLRVFANYVRLATTFALGLILVRFLVVLGDHVYGLTVLLGAGVGFAAILRDVAQASLVPSLGASYPRGAASFAETYHSANAVATGSAVLSLVAFAALGLQVDSFNVPEELLLAAKWFVWTKAAQVTIGVLLAPVCSMILVREWMVFHNAAAVLDRSTDVIAAAGLCLLPRLPAADTVWWYGTLTAALSISVTIGSATLAWIRDPQLRFRWSHATWAGICGVLKSSYAIALFLMSMCLYVRFDNFVMNHHFALAGNLVFGIAVQLTAYVRQMSQGLIIGMDAVAARLHSQGARAASLALLERSTRVQAAIVFPSTFIVLGFSDELVRFWVGSRLPQPEALIPHIATASQWLILGYAARSLSEGWTQMLSGVGQLRVFLGDVLWAAAANVAVVGLLAWIAPPPWMWWVPAAVFAMIMVSVHLGLLPRRIAAVLELRVRDVLQPLWRPLLVSLVACAWLIPSAVAKDGLRWSWHAQWWLLAIGSYGVGSFYATLRSEERIHLQALVGRLWTPLSNPVHDTPTSTTRPDPNRQRTAA